MTYRIWYETRIIFACPPNAMPSSSATKPWWMIISSLGTKVSLPGKHGNKSPSSIRSRLYASITSLFGSIGKLKNEENLIFVKNFSLLMEH